MDAARIPVGFITRAHGVRGDVLVVPLTDNPERFVAGAVLVVEGDDAAVTVRGVRPHNEGLILSLHELSDRNAAEAVVKQRLMIDAADRRNLAAGEYWPDDLIGLAAVSESGELFGEVTDVVLGEAQDRLVVTTPDGRTVEVPFVTELVDEPGHGAIIVWPPDGLFDP